MSTWIVIILSAGYLGLLFAVAYWGTGGRTPVGA